MRYIKDELFLFEARSLCLGTGTHIIVLAQVEESSDLGGTFRSQPPVHELIGDPLELGVALLYDA